MFTKNELSAIVQEKMFSSRTIGDVEMITLEQYEQIRRMYYLEEKPGAASPHLLMAIEEKAPARCHIFE